MKIKVFKSNLIPTLIKREESVNKVTIRKKVTSRPRVQKVQVRDGNENEGDAIQVLISRRRSSSRGRGPDHPLEDPFFLSLIRLEMEWKVSLFSGNQTSYKPQPVITLTQSLSAPIRFPEIEDVSPTPSTPPPSLGPPNTLLKKPGTLHRCKTAPAMVVMREFQPSKPQIPKPLFDSNSTIRQGTLLLSMYLLLGVIIYSFNTDHFSGIETHPVVDALYFCIVTMCTIGYGDITPLTPVSKVFACVFVLVGFGFIDILLSGLVNYVLDLQESMILTGIEMDKNRNHEGFSATDYIFDVKKGRVRIRLKVGLALGVVVLCIAVGTLVLYFLEDLDWIDSVYLAVMSVTTVGYGDRAF
ncbi:POTASSIUM CHANNEL SUBFAMILY K [Salix koriyanagi]|uniref:POTASSIUM CHANNEL SUBFAMILY K n=1 Tax=Salix koriyanagi TaxID=2511006 RepID=A0A9Q0Z6N7_9ROSI|nr:POTASSIUM CHANNEL SUBFAMILY K [Salix koriyanagi]